MRPAHAAAWTIAACLTLAVTLAMPGATRAEAAGSPYRPVCSNGEYLGDNGVGAAGDQWETRYIYYCPQGATVIQLLFTGGYADGVIPTERTLSDPQVMNLSVETFVPPVWDPNITYAVGAQVSGPTSVTNGGATYVAAAASLGRQPTGYNTAYWQPTTAHPVPITCNGSRPCVLGTHVDGSGKTVTNALLSTDPLAVNIAPGSLIAIRAYVKQSGTQVMANGPSQTPRAGSYQIWSSSLTDLTLSGSRASSGSAHNTGPFAIVGLQNVANPKPTVCVVGDSRVAGVAGLGMTWAPIANGGQGYQPTDIGRLVANVDSGGTSDSAYTSIVWVIQNVAGGKVTQAGVYFPGHYAIAVPGSTPGVASQPPVGPQPTRALYVGTIGSGLVMNIPAVGGLSGSAGIYEDPKTFAQGFVQKGLSDAGIPFAAFSRSSDRVSIWASPGGDTNRLAAIKASGCTSVIMGYGIKDSNAGETPAQMQAEYVTVAKQLLALGTVKGVYLATMHPQTDSTDYWVTTANQTPVGFEATRIAVNTWERTVPAPFAGTFDTAAPVEVNAANVPTINGHYWIVTGKPHYATTDRTHLTPATAILSAGAITARAGILQ